MTMSDPRADLATQLAAVNATLTEVSERMDGLDRWAAAQERVNQRLRDHARWLWGVTAIVAAVVLVLAVTVVRTMGLVGDVRDSQVAGCERGNEFRADVVESFDQNDVDFAEALAEITGASPEQLAEFLAVLRESREVPASLLPVNCEAVY